MTKITGYEEMGVISPITDIMYPWDYCNNFVKIAMVKDIGYMFGGVFKETDKAKPQLVVFMRTDTGYKAKILNTCLTNKGLSKNEIVFDLTGFTLEGTSFFGKMINLFPVRRRYYPVITKSTKPKQLHNLDSKIEALVAKHMANLVADIKAMGISATK